jgi:hypothetical protein
MFTRSSPDGRLRHTPRSCHAASLDDASRYAPQVVTYGVRGHAWDHVDPALPKFEKMPPARPIGYG